jgi:hypothetical protein
LLSILSFQCHNFLGQTRPWRLAGVILLSSPEAPTIPKNKTQDCVTEWHREPGALPRWTWHRLYISCPLRALGHLADLSPDTLACVISVI